MMDSSNFETRPFQEIEIPVSLNDTAIQKIEPNVSIRNAQTNIEFTNQLQKFSTIENLREQASNEILG